MTEAANPPGPWALWRAILSPAAGLTPAQRLALFVLVKWGDAGGGGAYPSLNRTAACTGLHRATAARALAALVEKGLVTRERCGRIWEYSVNLPAVLALDRSQRRTGRKREPVLECDIDGSRMRPKMVVNENSTVPITVPNYRASEKRAAGKRRLPSAAEPPTVDEVRAYLAELGETRFTAEAFHDYYAARGWQLKSGPVKDWRACVRTWRRNERGAAGPPPRPRSAPALTSVTAALPGCCAECGKPSALTLCEDCQLQHWGTVDLRESDLPRLEAGG